VSREAVSEDTSQSHPGSPALLVSTAQPIGPIRRRSYRSEPGVRRRGSVVTVIVPGDERRAPDAARTADQ
jgi:hypothetical protein